MKAKKEVAAIVLAAGSSSRLGTSKQLLLIDGEPLIVRTTKEVLLSMVSKTLVVVGANADLHKKAIGDLDVEVVVNTNWERGMGTSIEKGLQHLLKIRPAVNAVIICVCDQPMMKRDLLNRIMETYFDSESSIVASSYGESDGVPALFGNEHFAELLNLKPEKGAKHLLKRHRNTLSRVDFPEGVVDIDTRDDYEQFLKRNH